ncbi:MAG: HAD family hydrolase [Candidatus Omnitrophota bacterium]
MSNKKLFIFDLDGTLADAYRAIEKSLNFTLQNLGLRRVTFEEAKRKVGRGDKAFMETFFPESAISKALLIYRAHHKKALKSHSKLRPYAKELLRGLKRKHKIIAIASNRPSFYTNLILKSLGIKRYFDFVLCADEIKSNKPNPKILNVILKKFKVRKSDAVFVGDMDIDLETAKRAKMDVVFIEGGSSHLRAVRKYKNKKVISSLKEILSLYN